MVHHFHTQIEPCPILRSDTRRHHCSLERVSRLLRQRRNASGFMMENYKRACSFSVSVRTPVPGKLANRIRIRLYSQPGVVPCCLEAQFRNQIFSNSSRFRMHDEETSKSLESRLSKMTAAAHLAPRFICEECMRRAPGGVAEFFPKDTTPRQRELGLFRTEGKLLQLG